MNEFLGFVCLFVCFDSPLCFIHFPWNLEIWQEPEAISDKKYNLRKISNQHLKCNPKNHTLYQPLYYDFYKLNLVEQTSTLILVIFYQLNTVISFSKHNRTLELRLPLLSREESLGIFELLSFVEFSSLASMPLETPGKSLQVLTGHMWLPI